MSEDLSNHPEHYEHGTSHEAHEVQPNSVEVEPGHERVKKTAERHEDDPLLQSIGALKARVEREAKSTEDYDDLDEEARPSQAFMIHRGLKDESYQRTIQKARRQLNPVDKAFSKLIHQPAIEVMSTTAANTVGRASGLFVGSLFAFAGSAFLLYMTKRYGFSYNYGVFVLCFVGGFALGLLLELIVRLIRKRS